MENVNWFGPSLTWLGHASFSFVDEKGNRIYYVDPFDLPAGKAGLKVEKLQEADIIFITHAHYDHFSQSDIKKILKDSTVIVATADVLEKIDVDDKKKIAVSPNKNYDIKGFKFSTTPAYNNKPERLNFHPKNNNWVGYIFALNGKMIYHAGDTDFIEEMKALQDLSLDIAIIPIGGTYTMDVIEAAAAANAICAEITIPMHYRRLNQNYEEIEEKFKALVTSSKVVILEELK
ncbi:MAG: MBL fold metallo-hydrolase [Patescibacteria group bacterium]|nr:MBL fold metallo-hydrolase [Patescibacteria group bacterium]